MVPQGGGPAAGHSGAERGEPAGGAAAAGSSAEGGGRGATPERGLGAGRPVLQGGRAKEGSRADMGDPCQMRLGFLPTHAAWPAPRACNLAPAPRSPGCPTAPARWRRAWPRCASRWRSATRAPRARWRGRCAPLQGGLVWAALLRPVVMAHCAAAPGGACMRHSPCFRRFPPLQPRVPLQLPRLPVHVPSHFRLLLYTCLPPVPCSRGAGGAGAAAGGAAERAARPVPARGGAGHVGARCHGLVAVLLLHGQPWSCVLEPSVVSLADFRALLS